MKHATLLALVIFLSGTTYLLGNESTMSPEVKKIANESIDKAMRYLESAQQKDGGWANAGQSDPAITALIAKCFMQHHKYGAKHEVVKKAMDFVMTYRKEDGGIYPEGYGLRNYYTSVCLMALSAANNPEYKNHIKNAQDFLKKLQWDEGESIDNGNVWYGGAGYGKHKRPDLSNTQMMLEALHQSGMPSDDEVFRKAVTFVQRCQMMSQVNDQAFARGSDDGGFIYTAANNGESKAGVDITEDGDTSLRTYGSMTYAGFKSYLYANVGRADQRVVAAYKWIQKHYTLDENPNMPGKHSLQGLYYYYHVFSKALSAWGDPYIVDGTGKKHNWREDLCNKLRRLQNKDGSWINTADRWYEGNPNLATAYSVLAIQTALK